VYVETPPLGKECPASIISEKEGSCRQREHTDLYHHPIDVRGLRTRTGRQTGQSSRPLYEAKRSAMCAHMVDDRRYPVPARCSDSCTRRSIVEQYVRHITPGPSYVCRTVPAQTGGHTSWARVADLMSKPQGSVLGAYPCASGSSLSVSYSNDLCTSVRGEGRITEVNWNLLPINQQSPC